MERIKNILISIIVISATIFICSFFTIKTISLEDVYSHMDNEINEIFNAISLPVETSFISKEEINQSVSSEIIKERVQSMFAKAEMESYYSYSEDTIKEITTSIETIYTKEHERLMQADTKTIVLGARILLGSIVIILCAIYFVLTKKEKIGKKLPI